MIFTRFLNTHAKKDGIRCYVKNFIKFQKFSALDNKLMLARLYAKWNQPEKMEKAYRQCMELDPKSEMASLNSQTSFPCPADTGGGRFTEKPVQDEPLSRQKQTRQVLFRNK
ncbi:MAG: hypothetical protein IPP73_04910 [Chitinophagaceae bacterium]|nr:hypothetical protein [Chitinophagaceae bacterium]